MLLEQQNKKRLLARQEQDQPVQMDGTMPNGQPQQPPLQVQRKLSTLSASGPQPQPQPQPQQPQQPQQSQQPQQQQFPKNSKLPVGQVQRHLQLLVTLK